MFFGPDFSAGLRTALYRPFNPAGLAEAICIFIGLFILHQVVLQPLFAVGIVAATAGLANFKTEFMRGAMFSLLPAGLLAAGAAWLISGRRGDPKAVLALHFPTFGMLGWAAVVVGFVLAMYGFFFVVAVLFKIDLTSSGDVERAVAQLRNDPLFYLIAAGLVIGGPLAEELIFRGQLFAALAQSRFGGIGAAVVTSVLWAGVHITEPMQVIALLFAMGLALSWLLLRFGSLWVTIVCHAVWNGIQAVALSGIISQ